jgi:hypothetical protein
MRGEREREWQLENAAAARRRHLVILYIYLVVVVYNSLGWTLTASPPAHMRIIPQQL